MHAKTGAALAGSLIATLFLAGCMETMPRPDRPKPPRPDRPAKVCPMNYAPVCAARRGQNRTFGNACQARAEGWRIIANGECRGGGGRP